jgi:putative ABC transport system permease protein
MFNNYFKIAVRNFLRYKTYSTINILGLAVGIATCLLLFQYISFERSYDKFHEDSERIYRLRYERISDNGGAFRVASSCPPAAKRIRDNFPEVEAVGRAVYYKASMSHEDKAFFEERLYFAEPELFDVFSFEFLKGNPAEDLKNPNIAFISTSTAKKYFGDANPIGKVLSLDKKMDFEVIGLYENIPANSHLKFDMLLPWENILQILEEGYDDAWGHTGSYTYMKLANGTDPKVMETKFNKMVDDEFGDVLREYKMQMLLPMQAMEDIHLTSHFMQEYEANGDKNSVNFLFIIALFIIVMAWVNYINLSTSRAINRAREVGLRKVIGASRRQLMNQLFTETFLLNFAAVVIALAAVEIVKPLFANLTGIPDSYSIWSLKWFWPAVLSLISVGVLLSGIYPVLAISSFKPIIVLKGRFSQSARGISIRQVLVSFQFIMALLLITGTITVYEQITFMKNQDLGFNIEQTLVLKGPGVRGENFESSNESFKQALLGEAGINKVCVATEVPGRQIYWDAGGIMKMGEDISASKNYQIVGIDYDYVDLFNLEILYGRNFSRDFTNESKSLILNETAINWMGFEDAESAVGEKISYWGEEFTLIGVLKDFHQQSLKEEYEPHIYRFAPTGRGRLTVYAVKINTQNINESIENIKLHWAQFFPGNPFEFFFLDEYYDQQYRSDETFGNIFGMFAGLAIFITVLGIFGLASFNAVQRIKEIGIRKVLGASVSGIQLLLARDFIRLLVISFIIAIPLSYYGLNIWLQDFANRMSLNVWLFLIPFVLVSMITLLTVGYQTTKAALTNPADSLRDE